MPALAQYKVPALSRASGPVVTQQGNPWIFRVSLNDAAGAALLAAYAQETLGWKKIGISYVNTAFGQGGMAELLTLRERLQSVTSSGDDPPASELTEALEEQVHALREELERYVELAQLGMAVGRGWACSSLSSCSLARIGS